MSVELIPSNTTYTPQAIFNPHRQALLNHIPPIQDETENLARRINAASPPTHQTPRTHPRTNDLRERSMSPQRIQRKRTKGWRMPENTVYVGRGSKWGNPYKVVAQYKNGPFDIYHDDWFLGQSTGREGAQRIAVNKFLEARENYRHNIPDDATIQAELKGKNLACWCADATPCHADVLIELANS